MRSILILLLACLLLAGGGVLGASDLGCGRQFRVNIGTLRFVDQQTGANNTYQCANLLMSYTTDSFGNILGSLALTGNIKRIVSTPGNALSGPDGATLAVNLQLANIGDRQRGDIPVPVDVPPQPDWQYLRLVGGTLTSTLNASVAVIIRGNIVNNRQSALQFGSGAGGGNIGNLGAALNFQFRFNSDISFRSAGFLRWSKILSACSCASTYTFRNYDNNPFSSGQQDYAIKYNPKFQANGNKFTRLSAFTDYGWQATLFGYNPAIADADSANNFVYLRAFMGNQVAPNATFYYSMFFQGLPLNTPSNTPYGDPVVAPGLNSTAGWKYFNLANGTMLYLQSAQGYNLAQINSTHYPGSPPAPSGLLGPALQIGTGANTNANGRLGAFFSFMQIFRFGTVYNTAANLSIALTSTCP